MSNPITNEPTNYDGTVYWNINTWRKLKGYVTLETLRNYANLNSLNIFTSLNVFQSIVTSSINGIPDTVFAFLDGLTMNIQQTFTSILFTLTNVKFYQSNNTTHIERNLMADDLAVNNSINGSSLNVASINSNKVRTNEIRVNNVKCKNIVANNIISNDQVGVYLFIDVFFIPLMKSQSLPTYDEDTSVFIHVKPGYSVVAKDGDGKLLLSLENTTDDFLYFIPISNAVKTIELFLNGRKL